MDYTSNEDLDDLYNGDTCVILKGFVDEIRPPIYVQSKKDTLFKFILSTGTKRITCLVWGDALIDKFVKEISISRIVFIQGGFALAVAESNMRMKNNLILFDILIKEHTEVEFLGYHKSSQSEKSLSDVTFDDLPKAEGLIRIKGYIRTKINRSQSQNGLATFSVGSITDGKKRINIQVKNINVFNSMFEVGDCVTVIGVINDQGPVLSLVCNDMQCITLNEDKPMSSTDVQKGSRALKRVLQN